MEFYTVEDGHRANFQLESFFNVQKRLNPWLPKHSNRVKESGLYDRIENLPAGYVSIADCAYQLTEN